MTNVKDFVVTSQVKDIILFDSINNQFKVLKYQFKGLLEKPKTHKTDELVKVKLLEMEDEETCYDLQIMLKLTDNTKYYIKLINKATNKKSSKYIKAYDLAYRVVTYLDKMI